MMVTVDNAPALAGPVAALGGMAIMFGGGVIALLQQIPGIEGSGSGTVIAVLSAAVSAQTALIGWMVKQLFSGNWVRSDVNNVIAQHKEAVDALHQSAETNKKLIGIAFGLRDRDRDKQDDR